jgi:transcriptional regulator NrdR family protein
MSKRYLILSGIGIACMITFSFFFGNFNDNDIEKTLTESMEETKKEHQKIEELLTKVSQELKKRGYGEIPLRYNSEKRLLTIQGKDEKMQIVIGKK